MGCLALLLLAPLLPGRAHAAAQPGPLVVIVPATAADYSSVWLRFEPESVLAAVAWGEKVPAEQQVPRSTLPGQKVAPCDAEAGETDIYGNCWANMGDVKPPCGRRTFRHGDKCYRPIATDPKKPIGPLPDRPQCRTGSPCNTFPSTTSDPSRTARAGRQHSLGPGGALLLSPQPRGVQRQVLRSIAEGEDGLLEVRC